MFVIGILYRVINRYILPVFRITSAANSKMKQMQDQMNEMNSKINNNNPTVKKSRKEGDYIDYEEVK